MTTIRMTKATPPTTEPAITAAAGVVSSPLDFFIFPVPFVTVSVYEIIRRRIRMVYCYLVDYDVVSLVVLELNNLADSYAISFCYLH